MAIYSNQPVSFGQLLGKVFKGYPEVFKSTWFLVLGIAVLGLIGGLTAALNRYVATALIILILLGVIFIAAIIWNRANTLFAGNNQDLQTAIANSRQRYLFLLGGFVLLALIMILMGIIDFGLLQLGDMTGLNTLFTIIAVLITVLLGFAFYFALPTIVLERLSIFKSFEKSVRMFFKNFGNVVGVVLIIHVIIFSILLGVMALIPTKHILLSTLWDFVFQFFAYPLLVSTLLNLWHDSNLRLGKDFGKK